MSKDKDRKMNKMIKRNKKSNQRTIFISNSIEMILYDYLASESSRDRSSEMSNTKDKKVRRHRQNQINLKILQTKQPYKRNKKPEKIRINKINLKLT